jgi:NTE family protein
MLDHVFCNSLPDASPIVLALSGGSARGIAHIGVAQYMFEQGITPSGYSGVSVGGLIGALLATGRTPKQILEITDDYYWPTLLFPAALEKFCSKFLPSTFSDLERPLLVVATGVNSGKSVPIETGNLRSAICASCAIHYLQRRVIRSGEELTDGGASCVLPSKFPPSSVKQPFIVGSDVCFVGSMARGIGTIIPSITKLLPQEYAEELRTCDVLIQPDIPLHHLLPIRKSISRLVGDGWRCVEMIVAAK